MALTPGTRFGTYEVIRALGAGGMGEVYLARDTKLGREVALKVLPAEVAGDPDRLARFQREARTVAALNHPNLVTLHAVEEAHGVPYLVMERIAGRPLGDVIPPGGLPVARILDIGVAIASALAAAHDKGIVHRDLKPANVMVTDEGLVKVLDFGLAKTQVAATSDGETAEPTATATQAGIAGTIPYMAPEQLRGERVDARTDVFAFGTLLYEMAAGRRPFRGDSPVDTMTAILQGEPHPIEDVRQDLPPRLTRIVKRCLEKDPRRRVQSAIDLRHELQDLADELRSGEALSGPAGATQAPPTSAKAEVKRPGRRLKIRTIAAIATAAIVVVVVGTTLVIKLSRPGGSTVGSGQRIASLAVLPFENMTHDASQDFFVEGIHEAIITDLAKLGSVRVTSRNSVLRYKGPNLKLKDVAHELGVDALIEGSVLRTGTQVRITAQLILGKTDEHVWAESYDRDVKDVLRLLSEVSRAIAGEVDAKLGQSLASASPQLASPVRASPAPTSSVGTGGIPQVLPEAYEAYLRGRQAIGQAVSPTSANVALGHFERAAALDPGFAGAWSGIAMASLLREFIAGSEVRATTALAAQQSATKALALDARDGDAHAVLGALKLYRDWDFEAARPMLERAVTLSPHDSMLRHVYGDYFLVTGRVDESLEQVKLGRDFDPSSPLPEMVVIFHTMVARKFDDVIAEGRRAMEIFPTIRRPVEGMVAGALWRQRKFDEAMPGFKASYGPDAEAWRVFEAGYQRGGPAAARTALGDYLAARAPGDQNVLGIAAAYAEGGNAAKAMPWLEKAFAARLPQLLHVPATPAYDPIREDPRFKDLLRRIGIAPARR